MKQQNLKNRKSLAVLLILSSLLLGLGLLFEISYCGVKRVVPFYMDNMAAIFGEMMILFAFTIIPLAILIILDYVMYAALLIFMALTAGEVVISAVLAVKSSRQGKKKSFLKAALLLNFIAAVCLLLLDLLFIFMGAAALRLWDILAVFFCLAGGILLIPGGLIYRRLDIS